MGASYWAKWACDGHIEDLPNLVLPLVLAEDYDLLNCNRCRQVFDRGGLMKKIAWSLNGGRWSDAPVDLTITYSFLPGKTAANFYWKLDVSPFPTTEKERASLEGWVREQLNRIVAILDRQVEQPQVGAVADEPLSLRTGRGLDSFSRLAVGERLTGTYATPRPVRARSHLQCASACVEEPPTCDRCGKPAVAIPGTAGRHYCLTCQRHLPGRVGGTVS